MKKNAPAGLRGSRAVKISLTAIMLAGLAGCVPFGREFREAASPAVRTGVTEIVNGVLEGIFAVVDQNAAGRTTGP